MKKIFNGIICLMLLLVVCVGFVGCDKTASEKNNDNSQKIAEKIELSSATLGDVEFDNAKTVKLDKSGNTFTVSGTVPAMSKSQILAFGVQDVTHCFVIKLTFDKEKTISTFSIKGNTEKVYSVDSKVNNYVGSISDLLDSEDGEDAFCYLVLAANTEKYEFTATYSDKTTSHITLKVTATLATAEED